MIPLEKVQQIVNTYKTLEKELASSDIGKKDFVKKSKEYSGIGEIIDEAKGYLDFEKEKLELDKIIEDKKSDKEMIQLAKSELNELLKKKQSYEKILKVYLLPKDEADSKNAIVEIRAGTGGLEATLFVADLYKMYEKVCLKKNWSLEIINISKSDAGGFKEVILLIKGANIYSFLKFESGVHRVQRVPETETQGRVHTSAATVAVLPEAEEVDVKIEDKDLRIDVFRSTGAGGQSVNTTDSAVRITHIPTGIVVTNQDEKSQHKNRAKGMKILRSRIYESEREKKEKERSRDRKNQIGTGDRSERIRTYNFPQGRITDHRINLTLHKLEEFLSGDVFDELVQNLMIQDQEIKLTNLGKIK
jgi:peptide chain release factor 1